MLKKIILPLVVISLLPLAAVAQEAKVKKDTGEIKGETVFCELSCKTNKETCEEVCGVQEESERDACAKGCVEAYDKCMGLCKG